MAMLDLALIGIATVLVARILHPLAENAGDWVARLFTGDQISDRTEKRNSDHTPPATYFE